MLLELTMVLLFLVYLNKIRKPLVLTSNSQLKQISLGYIFPILVVNAGILQTVISNFFLTHVIQGAQKHVINMVVDGVTVTVERYEIVKMSNAMNFYQRVLRLFYSYEINCNETTTGVLKNNIILVHGLNGSSDSKYMITTTNLFLNKGCRVFCLNDRGQKSDYNGYKITSFGYTDDIKALTQHILDSYNGNIFYVGFSQGANNTTVHAGTFDHERIKGGISVCNPFNFEKLTKLETEGTFFQRIGHTQLVLNFKKYLLKVTKECWSEKNLVQLCQSLTNRGIFKDKTFADFCYRTSSEYYVEKLKKPWLFINANDDPIVPVDFIPKEKIVKNSNTGLVLLQGGHLGFKSIFFKSTIDSIIETFYSLNK